MNGDEQQSKAEFVENVDKLVKDSPLERFINQDVDDSSNLTLAGIGNVLELMSWKPGGNTEIGTYLRSKILEPLVYSKLEPKSLERPLLISVITDGMPSGEKVPSLWIRSWSVVISWKAPGILARVRVYAQLSLFSPSLPVVSSADRINLQV